MEHISHMIDERYAEVDSLSKGERFKVNRGYTDTAGRPVLEFEDTTKRETLTVKEISSLLLYLARLPRSLDSSCRDWVYHARVGSHETTLEDCSNDKGSTSGSLSDPVLHLTGFLTELWPSINPFTLLPRLQPPAYIAVHTIFSPVKAQRLTLRLSSIYC
uniref:Uncharacterized protein n=1 Tax=Vespula pensylvanica TaxID=30213 RepID=A0A834JU23_VESPE|nr:hypothetical protein H0235_016982 [Vespula pensylvanica]